MADPVGDQDGQNQLENTSTLENQATHQEENQETKVTREAKEMSSVQDATYESGNQKQGLDRPIHSPAENGNLNANNDIKPTGEDFKQLEEEFALLFVSDVLGRVVKELSSTGDSEARGDNFVNNGKSPGGKSDTKLENEAVLDQGSGDYDKVAAKESEKDVEPSPIVVPTDRHFPEEKVGSNISFDDSSSHNLEDEKKGSRSTNLSKCNEPEFEKENSSLKGHLPHSQEGHEVSFHSSIQGDEFHQADHETYYHQFQDDNTSHMDRTSTIPERVLEVQIPQSMLKSYAAGHIISVQAYQHHNGDFIPHSQVSHSYPPQGELFSLQNNHSQTFSQRSTPTQKLVQFPQLRTSSTGFQGQFLSAEQRSPSRFSQRQKLPPAVARMSSVMMSTRERTEKQRMMSSYYEERTPAKLLSLDQCINSRPPMPFDLDTPGPCRYTPPNQPLYETNAPKYTFGSKFYEKDGGGRTAWAKTWFNSQNSHTTKVNFEHRWPSPANHSSSRSLVGRKLPTKMTYPSFSVGVRSNFSISKRGSENEPSPNEYNPWKADRLRYNTGPAFSMTFRHKGTSLWSSSEYTPGPNSYSPRVTYTSSKPHRPAFTIQGIRRPKSHALGPHATF